ncbi:MAG: hypothetical protein COA33_010065 [Fluviicola sp.]|nr:hypothetical protein [Fluviicola sp.]
MKKITILLSILFFVSLSLNSFSQSFSGKGSKQFQIGIGVTKHNAWYPTNGTGPKGRVKPLAGALYFQFELGIHKYIGVGMHLGGEFSSNLKKSTLGILIPSLNYSSFYGFGIPIGFHSNFHFFQLIADKSSKGNMSEKLDIYAGLSIGSGVAFAIPKKEYKYFGSDVGYMLYGGIHAGIRYYLKEKLGIYAEIGHGRAYINGGMVLSF